MLVNDIFDGGLYAQFGTTVWEHDLVKAAVQRMTIAQAYELGPHQASAVAVTPGWMRSTALAADPEVARWSGQVMSSGQLARIYGFTDTDGTQPDCWRYVVEVQDKNLPANDHGYR